MRTKTTPTAAAKSLSRDGIVDRAVGIAAVEGLDAVSIRRLAQEFGVTPMALYWHVENKDELLAAMGDRIFAGIALPADPTAPWDQRLRELMLGLVAGLRRHPALLPLAFQRVLISPDGLSLTETTLQILHEGGLSNRAAANTAAHALRTAIGLIADQPGTEQGRPDPDLEAHRAEKIEYLNLLPAALYPRLLESVDDLLDCNDQGQYDAFGIDLFVAGVHALAARARR